MAKVHSGEEILPKVSTPDCLSRVHECYRQTDDRHTDGFAIAKTLT